MCIIYSKSSITDPWIRTDTKRGVLAYSVSGHLSPLTGPSDVTAKMVFKVRLRRVSALLTIAITLIYTTTIGAGFCFH